MTREEFIEKAKLIEDKHYDYSKVVYTNNKTRVCIICPIHGEFWQTPNSHLSGNGCSECNNSKLEQDIKILLMNNNIRYEQRKHFDWLGKQHLDFYIPEKKIAIECQGIQHFEPISFFGGEEGFISRLERDKRKKKLCEENNVTLLYYSPFEHDGIYNNKELLIKEIRYGL